MREDLARDLLAQMGQRVPSKLVDFGRALSSFFGEPAFDDWPSYLEKPYNWAREYAAWASADYPQDGDEGWPMFVVAMDALVDA